MAVIAQRGESETFASPVLMWLKTKNLENLHLFLDLIFLITTHS